MENEFLRLAAERYSVRRFTEAPIPKAVLDEILRAGRVAPTAHNNQPQRVLALQSPEALAKLRRCTECHYGAPAALLVCYDRDRSWKREFDGKDSGDIDASIVTTHMMLAAASLGVGSTWVMYFIPEAVREEFSLPPNLEPTAILLLGYPAPDAKPAPGHAASRPTEDMVAYNEF